MAKRLVLCVLVACGSNPVVATGDAQAPFDGSVDAGADVVDGSGEIFPAFAPDLPTVVNTGGPTLIAPKLIPVFYADEDASKVTKVTDFLSKLPGSAYWTATTSEYGVASLTIAPKVSLAESSKASITRTEIETWLTDAIATSKVPANEPSKTVYALYFPQATVVQDGTDTSCINFGGFHNATNGAAYLVVPGCASYASAKVAPGEVLQGLDFATGTTAHELVEAVSDPYQKTQPAYGGIDKKHLAWSLYLYGGEVADMCEPQPHAFYQEAALGYAVQRSWSNKNAMAGHDPCVPVAGAPFVAAFPAVDAAVGTGLGVGAKTTIPIHLVSDGPTNGFAVKAIDYASEHGKPAQLALTLDKSSGKNGDTLMLTIQVLAADSSYDEGYILETEIDGIRRRTAGVVHQ